MLVEHPQFTEGIDFNTLYAHLQNSIQSVEARQPFTAFPIVITSARLQELVSAQRPYLKQLPLNSDAVIHKHLLRDRSEVTRRRNEKKKGRH